MQSEKIFEDFPKEVEEEVKKIISDRVKEFAENLDSEEIKTIAKRFFHIVCKSMRTENKDPTYLPVDLLFLKNPQMKKFSMRLRNAHTSVNFLFYIFLLHLS